MIRRPPRSPLFPSTTLYRSTPRRREPLGSRRSSGSSRSTPTYRPRVTERDKVFKRRRLATFPVGGSNEIGRAPVCTPSHANISYAVLCLKKHKEPYDQSAHV